jgi:hypothetical protein
MDEVDCAMARYQISQEKKVVTSDEVNTSVKILRQKKQIPGTTITRSQNQRAAPYYNPLFLRMFKV